VSHHLYIQALKPGDPRKYTARVLCVDHDTETALLTVDDPQFFEGTIPVRFGELPFRNARVSVYGFPMGGNELCVTAGIVSRIEVRAYTHSQRHLLALQTDAAINPGNSGGPVFMNDELIGIAFQSYKQKDLEKAGYVVPIPIIRHLFDDLDDGTITGVPDLGIYWQKIENTSLRDHVGLTGGRTGVLITRAVHGSSADGVLQEGDVLTAIDGVPVASDGSIPLRAHDRVHFSYLVSRHQVGAPLAVEILRRGEPLRLTVQLRKLAALVPPPQPGLRPTYFIFAGLVFLPLTYDYMATWKWDNGLLSWNHNRFPSAALVVARPIWRRSHRYNSQQSVNAAKGVQLVFQFQAAIAPEANCGEQIEVLHNLFASFGCLCRNNRLSGHIQI